MNALAPILGSTDKTEKYYGMTANKDIKQGLVDNTNEAVSIGAFGAPTLIVKQAGSDKEHVFFGSDRFEMIAKLLGLPYPGLDYQPSQAKL